MPEIHHQLKIRGPQQAVYDALTTKEGLASWWTKDVTAQPVVGSVAEFGFGHHAVVFKMRVAELTPPTRVRWQCEGGHPEWDGTEVVFTLAPIADGTMLRFDHLRWQWRDGILAQCSYDWAMYLMSLKHLIERGTGEPHGA